jgi:P27 family predicted phage terminase small subunit
MEKNVVHIGKGKDTLVKVPKPPIYLTDDAKKYYKSMGNILAKDELIKEKYLPALEIYAEAQSQFQFAITEIKKANQDKFGSGYFQKFTSGAMNISVYVTLKEKAEDSILKCCKLFGLDPKSEKELKLDTGQMDLFQELLKQKHA